MVRSVEKIEGSHTVRDSGSPLNCWSIHRDLKVNRLSLDIVRGRHYGIF